MPTVKLFDAAKYLRDETAMAAYLEAAKNAGDPAVLAQAVCDVARARAINLPLKGSTLAVKKK